MQVDASWELGSWDSCIGRVKVGFATLRLDTGFLLPKIIPSELVFLIAMVDPKMPEVGDVVSIESENSQYKFKLTGVLGMGTCGKVFRAVDINSSRLSEVAIKFSAVTQKDCGPKRWASMVGEASATFFIGCPTLVPVLDWGKLEGRIWMTMPVYDGSLTSLLRSLPKGQKVLADVILGVALDTAMALKHLHEQGKAHM